MGRDTIQLENAVSTISHEYLLEFTSEYGISESLHLELPGPEDLIMEFPKGKEWIVLIFTKITKNQTISTQDQKPQRKARSGSKISSNNLTLKPNLSKFQSLRTISAQRSKPDPSKVKNKSPGTNYMDLFSLISAPNPTKVKTGTRPRAAHEVPLLTATANHVIDIEDMTGASESPRTPSTVEKSPLDFSRKTHPH
nr:hypothetical protein [Tanacetum cinerariifolium]